VLKLLSKNPSSQAKPVATEARIKWFCTTFLLFVELGLPSGKHKCLSTFELTSGSGPSKKASEKTLLDKDSTEPSQLHFRCHHTLQLLLVRNFLLFSRYAALEDKCWRHLQYHLRHITNLRIECVPLYMLLPPSI
jgi:hypothetical protein